MPTVPIRELTMHYELAGEGEPLVMIMGLGANGDWWDPPAVRQLAKDFRLLIFDNRDAGRTTGPSRPYTIKDMADDTAGLMDKVGFSRAHVLGLSMGGMIAQELALNHPEKVNRLVLGCTSPGVTQGVQPSGEVLKLLTVDRRSQSLLQVGLATARVIFAPGWLLSHLYVVPALLARMARCPIQPDGFERQLAAITAFDSADRLGRIKAPTLVLHGDRDVLLPPENGRILARLIPGAKLVTFPGCAHAFNSENPRLFVATVREFLKV